MAEIPTFAIAGPGTEYTIDPTTLRMSPLDPAAMIVAANDLLTSPQRDSGSPESVANLGVAALMLAVSGETERAEQLLPQILSAMAGTPRQRVATLLRCVQVLQAAGRFTEAVSAAHQALELVNRQADALPLEDFALHHLGKALLDAGDAEAARAFLVRALHLRELKGTPSLVLSTRLALASASGNATTPGEA